MGAGPWWGTGTLECWRVRAHRVSIPCPVLLGILTPREALVQGHWAVSGRAEGGTQEDPELSPPGAPGASDQIASPLGRSGAFLALPLVSHSICVSPSSLSFVSPLCPSLWHPDLWCPFLGPCEEGGWLAAWVCAHAHGVILVCSLGVAVCVWKRECVSVDAHFLTKKWTRAL